MNEVSPTTILHAARCKLRFISFIHKTLIWERSMKNFYTITSIGGLAALVTLAGCGSMNPPNDTNSSGTTYYPQSTTSKPVYGSYGVVQSVELVRQENSGLGAGAIVGAVVGGIVGNQVGRGSGNTAATVIGAAGGAYAGNQIQKSNQQQSDAYRLTIRMTDGTNLSLMQSANTEIRVGDRVVVESGVARRY